MPPTKSPPASACTQVTRREPFTTLTLLPSSVADSNSCGAPFGRITGASARKNARERVERAQDSRRGEKRRPRAAPREKRRVGIARSPSRDDDEDALPAILGLCLTRGRLRRSFSSSFSARGQGKRRDERGEETVGKKMGKWGIANVSSPALAALLPRERAPVAVLCADGNGPGFLEDRKRRYVIKSLAG
ncbi:hypothetical protein MRX96_007392 [Rhipicephalus microplus]